MAHVCDWHALPVGEKLKLPVNFRPLSGDASQDTPTPHTQRLFLLPFFLSTMTDYDIALLAGALYHSETFYFRYDGVGPSVATATVTVPSDRQIAAALPRLIAERDARYAAAAAVGEFRIAVRTTRVPSTRKVPLRPECPWLLVNEPCMVDVHTPIVIRKGVEEAKDLYWEDHTDVPIDRAVLAEYEDIVKRIAQIQEHCKGVDLTRDQEREIHSWYLLTRRKTQIDAILVRHHKTWLRRKAVMVAWAAANTAPASVAATETLPQVGEW